METNDIYIYPSKSNIGLKIWDPFSYYVFIQSYLSYSSQSNGLKHFNHQI